MRPSSVVCAFAAGPIALVAGCVPAQAPITPTITVDAAAPATGADGAPAGAPPARSSRRVVEIALGPEYTCARTEAREVYCWGQNDRGQLGDGTTQNRPTPARVPLPGPAVQIGAGNYHTCARLEGGAVWCWGSRQVGEVGDGTRGDTPAPSPLQVVGVTAATRVDVGEGTSCATKADGSAWCWGVGYDALGHGHDAAAEVPALRGAIHMGLAPVHGCAQFDAGAVRCWADRSPFKLLGTAAVRVAATPVAVPGLPPARSISARAFRTCAVADDASVYCWGADLGARTNAPLHLAETSRVPGLWGVRSVAVQIYHLCVVLEDRTVSCLGDNKDGRLGDGTFVDRTEPRRVTGVVDVEEVDVGEHHSCARTRGGLLFCWGGNEDGQIGDGTQENRPLAVEIRL